MPPPPLPTTTRRTLLGIGAAGAVGLGACRATSSDSSAADERSHELDELFAHLTDQTHTGEPIRPDERAERRVRAARLLAAEKTDAVLVEPGATLQYLTGVRWGTSERLFGLVLVADGSHFWISPAFEAQRARGAAEAAGISGDDIVPWDEHEHATRPLVAALHARGIESLAIEPRCRFFVADRIGRELGRDALRSAEPWAAALRGAKDEHELALLERANLLTKQALVAVSEALRPGLTETDIRAMIQRAQERLGLTSTWALALIGPSAAEPHGKGGDTRLAPGDVVLIDTGGTLHGYRSDITRSWVFGASPDDEVVRVWNLVRDAQKRAFETMGPGVPAGDVDAAARAVVAAGGFGAGYEHFTHRLGHGIGLEVHEEPYLDGGNRAPLVVGNTFSDEPGIYLRGRFGIRIEDIVHVTAAGAGVFGTWQRGPESPA